MVAVGRMDTDGLVLGCVVMVGNSVGWRDGNFVGKFEMVGMKDMVGEFVVNDSSSVVLLTCSVFVTTLDTTDRSANLLL